MTPVWIEGVALPFAHGVANVDAIVAASSGVVDVVVASSSSDGDSFFAVVAGFFIGLYLVYDGFGKWKTKRLIEDTPTERVRSMAVGRTELEGVARKAETTIEAPFTDDECVFVKWEVEEYRKDPDDDDYEWVTIAQDTQGVPFELDDGTGRVLVRADIGDPTVEISSTNTAQFKVGRRQDPPPEVAEFIERHDNQDDDEDGTGFFGNPVDSITGAIGGGTIGYSTITGAIGGGTIGYSNRRRRYTQEIIPEGTDVYILASAVPREVDGMTEGQQDLLEITREEGLDKFLISDMSEDELESHYERRGPLEIVGGIALSAICLAVLLGMF